MVDSDDEPTNVEKPVNADEPINVDKPVDADEPANVDKPVDADEPVNVDKSVDDDQPTGVDKPAVADELTNTDEPEDIAASSIALDAQSISALDDDPIALVEKIYQLWWHWADFQLFIISPTIEIISPPKIILAEHLPHSNELEFVYPIIDEGYRLRTSKAGDMFSAGMSMCKLYYTIEKMIFLLVERLKANGVSGETEVQVAFGGHELAQRKGFESIINLSYNVVVTNFDPGPWGERYLEMVKRLADKGYGYPPESPRDIYRHPHAPASTPKQS